MAVEPPSPTDGSPAIDFAERHQRSQLSNAGAEEPRRDLQRNKTVPARRSRSSSDVADGPDNERHHRRRRQSPASSVVDEEDQTRRGSKNRDLLNPTSLEDNDVENDDEDNDAPRTSCRVYRVRSFTTKKGGSVVNRGDSIKICGSGAGGRRGSQLLITPTNDADLLGGGLQAPSQSSSLRRRSVACLASGSGSRLQPEVVGVGIGASHSRRHSFIIRPPSAGDAGGGLGRRTSLRGNERQSAAQTDRGTIYRVELTLRQNLRRPSADRLSGVADATDQLTLGNADGANESGNLPNSVDADNNDENDDDDDDEDVQVYKVMVLGSHGVGKTTLVQQLLTSEYLANVDEDQGQLVTLSFQRSADYKLDRTGYSALPSPPRLTRRTHTHTARQRHNTFAS